ncbi:peflin [Folsomia candida]|uniref:peflin n=1 Tax=Folsomia candida TaxID=158441 RepID=UPI000B909DBB|nr:peflin [Folsomia candida]
MDPQLISFFNAVDVDRSGRINPTELQQVLQSSNGRKFSENACRLMIGLFDPGNSGSIDMQGFSALYAYVNQWLGTFKNFDRNSSGFIDEGELSQAMGSMGYRFSPGFVAFLMHKFGEGQFGLPVDGFISACILIHKFTDGFRKKDTSSSGMIQISYEDFLQMVLTGC